MKKSILKDLFQSVKNSNGRPQSLSDRLIKEIKDLGREWLNENLLRIINYYPPYLGAGIRVDEFDEDFRYIRVKMDLTWWNQNYVGTQFGGSLYSMCDPFYMLMLMNNLGAGYEVWDKSASIRFRNPGHGTVHAEFELDDNDLARIREAVKKEGVSEPEFTVDVESDDKTLIAQVEKQLHVTTPDAN